MKPKLILTDLDGTLLTNEKTLSPGNRAALERAARGMQAKYHVGVVQCKDNFYGQHSPETMPRHTWLTDRWEAWKACGALASEMESAALYTNAAAAGVNALCIVTISDGPEEITTAEERQTAFTQMMEVALSLA